MRHRVIQTQPLENRVSDEAERLRKQARGTYPGVERDRLLRLARQAETAAQISDWLKSPGPLSPK